MAGLQDLLLLEQFNRQQEQIANPFNSLIKMVEQTNLQIEEERQRMKEKKQEEEDFAMQMKFDQAQNTYSGKLNSAISPTIPKRTITRTSDGKRKIVTTQVRNPQLDIVDSDRRQLESDERIELINQQTKLTEQQSKKLELEQKQITTAQDDRSRIVKDSAQDVLNSISEVEKTMGHFGMMGDIPAFPGTSKVNWQANIDKILSGKIIDIMTKMKEASKTGSTGFGQLSNKELDVLRQSSTALKKALPPAEAKRYLDIMKQSLRKIIGSDSSLTPRQKRIQELRQKMDGK